MGIYINNSIKHKLGHLIILVTITKIKTKVSFLNLRKTSSLTKKQILNSFIILKRKNLKNIYRLFVLILKTLKIINKMKFTNVNFFQKTSLQPDFINLFVN